MKASVRICLSILFAILLMLNGMQNSVLVLLHNGFSTKSLVDTMTYDNGEAANLDADEDADQCINIYTILKLLRNTCLMNNYTTWEFNTYSCNVFNKFTKPPENGLKHLA